MVETPGMEDLEYQQLMCVMSIVVTYMAYFLYQGTDRNFGDALNSHVFIVLIYLEIRNTMSVSFIMAGPRSIKMSVMFIGFTLVCTSHAFTELDFINLQNKMELMDRKIEEIQIKDAAQQKTILMQQDVIRNQENAIADIQRDLMHHSEALAKLETSHAKQNVYIKQQTRKLSAYNRKYKNIMKSMSISSELKPLQQQQGRLQLDPEHVPEADRNANIDLTVARFDKRVLQQQDAAQERKKRLVVSDEGPIAFTTALSSSAVHLGIKQNIVFDTIVLNVGSGYHSRHGLFIVPQNGIYIFASTILSVPNGEVHADIVHNGQRVAIIYAHGDSGRHDQGSQTVVLQVDQGDEVWVRNIDNTDDSIYGYGYSTFSGYLLWPL